MKQLFSAGWQLFVYIVLVFLLSTVCSMLTGMPKPFLLISRKHRSVVVSLLEEMAQLLIACCLSRYTTAIEATNEKLQAYARVHTRVDFVDCSKYFLEDDDKAFTPLHPTPPSSAMLWTCLHSSKLSVESHAQLKRGPLPWCRWKVARG